MKVLRPHKWLHNKTVLLPMPECFCYDICKIDEQWQFFIDYSRVWENYKRLNRIWPRKWNRWTRNRGPQGCLWCFNFSWSFTNVYCLLLMNRPENSNILHVLHGDSNWGTICNILRLQMCSACMLQKVGLCVWQPPKIQLLKKAGLAMGINIWTLKIAKS